MQWEGREESKNVDDRRGRGKAGLAIGGIGGLIVVILGLVFGVDIQQFLGPQGGNGGGDPNAPRDPAEERLAKFSKTIFRDTEIVWEKQFQQLDPPRQYKHPTLVLFTGHVQTQGCGDADSGVGPFYCPGDSSVYIDVSFFQVLEEKLGAPGEFARAYVIAHEVGHHVQRLLGYSARVDEARRTQSKTVVNEYSVRLELQADYLAGVWAHHAQKTFPNMLEPGDLESATNAAFRIGDDHLQMQARGRVQKDTFTHGTSKQRQRWFLEGFRSGDVRKARALFDLPYNQL